MIHIKRIIVMEVVFIDRLTWKTFTSMALVLRPVLVIPLLLLAVLLLVLGALADLPGHIAAHVLLLDLALPLHLQKNVKTSKAT